FVVSSDLADDRFSLWSRHGGLAISFYMVTPWLILSVAYGMVVIKSRNNDTLDTSQCADDTR
ncbi:MAG: hypothetical protein ACI9OU_002605, partial [Candidatus Promineifilaceae bacterium]